MNAVAVDASHLYWTSVPGANDGAIWVIGLDGSNIHTIVTGQGVIMGGLAVDADHIYWTSSTDFSNGHGAVWSADLNGNNQQMIVPNPERPGRGGSQRRPRVLGHYPGHGGVRCHP